MKLKIKRLNKNAVLPKYAHDTDSCMDISVIIEDNHLLIPPHSTAVLHTGLSIEPEKGYATKLYVRSSTGIKKGLTLANGTGIIDQDYRGELLIALHNNSLSSQMVKNGERVAQLEVVNVEQAEIIEVDELSETERGQGGIGSTGA